MHRGPALVRQLKDRLAPFAGPLTILAIIVSAALTAYWSIRIPASGEAVSLLGAVAVFMALRGETKEIHGSEKIAWIIIVFCLLSVELRAIRKDRRDNEVQQATVLRDERGSFRGILDQGQRNFDTTIDKLVKTEEAENDQFIALLREDRRLFLHENLLAKDERDQLTGGDSYGVVMPIMIPVDEPNAFALAILVGRKRKRNPIPDARVWLRELPIPNEGTMADLTDFLAGRSGRIIYDGFIEPESPQLLPTRIKPSMTGETSYIINIEARNKGTSETLKVRKNAQTSAWEYSYKVIREVKAGSPGQPGVCETLEVTEPEWRQTVFAGSYR